MTRGHAYSFTFIIKYLIYMSNNKKILIAILACLALIIVFIVMSLNAGKDNKQTNAWSGGIKVWILEDDATKFYNYLTKFKELNQSYKNLQFSVESFDSYEDYSMALSHAIIKWEAPDIFMLNNSEKTTMFDKQTLGFLPEIINPNDFRRKYKWAIANDLISTAEYQGKNIEYLKGVPVGYETLWVFHNRRYVKTTDVSTFSTLNKVISKYNKDKPEIIPIALWNGSTVEKAEDIITQFLIAEDGVTGVSTLTSSNIKEPLAQYYIFGDTTWKNAYNNQKDTLNLMGQNNLDLFSKWKTFMVVGYPRMIQKIAEKGYSKTFLLASTFPQYYSGNQKLSMNYNYFVVNKDSQNTQAAQDILNFMTTDIGAEEYLKEFPYYFPALLSLEEDALERKIHKDFNVVLNDFYNSEAELISFDKGIIMEFNKNIIPVLDNSTNYLNAFEWFLWNIKCKTKKIINLEGLSTSCGK